MGHAADGGGVMDRRGVIAAVAVLALVLAGVGTKLAVDAAHPRGSDQEQLERMLVDGQSAVERKDIPGVTRFISEDYRDSLGLSASSVKYQIGDYLRSHGALQLNIPSRSVEIQVNPDGKTGSVRFHVTATSASANGSSRSDMDMSLGVKKERVYYYVVFPGEEWRVTSAEGYAALEGM